ncbi:hypothetical protein BGZ96_005923, partial [Linnemannia gamsii]
MAKSRLTSLSLNRVCFTHKGFTAILQNSPVLRKLSLSRVIVIHYDRAFELFKNSSVTSLHASLAEVCLPKPGPEWTPCLLHHFSLLEEWHLPAVDRSRDWGIDAYLRDELKACCPRLKTFRFDQMENTDKLSDLLFNCIWRPESCIFPFENLNERLTFSMVTHNSTLTQQHSYICHPHRQMRRCCGNGIGIPAPQVLPASQGLLRRGTCFGYGVRRETRMGSKDLRELRVQFKGLEDAQAMCECVQFVSLKRQRRAFDNV